MFDNRSFADGVFLNQLKLARIVPTFKFGNCAVPSNYKPLSIITFCEVFEKLFIISVKFS